MLAFFTGPMELNLYQRRRAKSMGLALSQNGLTGRATGRQLNDGTEKSVYAILDMPYLQPEERDRWARGH